MTAYPLAPSRSCDVLMKGGITSGVIYPHAVCELARHYKLASVGGSSAGAIAAAAAATAEFGRAADGFDKLESLPDDLMAKGPDDTSLLFRLFQPQDGTAGLYRVFTSGLGKSGFGRWSRTVLAALVGFAGWALLGALPGLALVVLGILGEGVAAWAAIVGGVLVLLVGVVALVATGLVRSIATKVPANKFGLCNGMAGKSKDTADPLTVWLHGKLQDMAGRTAIAAPITFGQLAGAGIELRMMTTNLTRHQPMRMPWPEREYYFDPDELRTLFPADVVQWMCEHPPPLPTAAGERWSSELRRSQALPKVPFPLADDVPVIVATRMSLSFPVLISAVPLYAVDFTHPDSRDAGTALSSWHRDHPEATVQEAKAAVPGPKFEVNWFSDGGIASNLPVHFFDSPLPARPTFAVDLAPFPPGMNKDTTDEAKNTLLPVVNQGGLNRRWTRWDLTGLGSVRSFARSILDTARGWVDEAQLVMPGYRDRIVTIYHDHAEGGMNLTMEDDVVKALVERGEAGAAKLVDRFVRGDGWDNHRWIRFRTSTAGLDGWLAGFQRGYDELSPGAKPYADFAGPAAAADLPSYALNGGRRAAVNLRTDALLTLAATWQKPPADAFTHGSPRPRPVLRLVPGTLFDPITPATPAPGTLAVPPP
jgi:predicted acylesterase/phospholipase RssA